MKPFLTIAMPHKDVLSGVPTFDIFAADLWNVHQKRGPSEYCNAELFFQKTYLTDGLQNLLSNAEKRLKGKGGDSVIQLQTPFGGGKTHSLIALYHKTKEWKSKVVVLDGVSLNPQEKTLWEEIEEQLTGKVDKLKGKSAPGKERIYNLLKESAPVLILMDEVLTYQTKSATVKVGESTLAAQNLAFLQELTQAVSTLGNCLLVMTLPASRLEHYDESAERLFQQLQKVVGRIEKVYEPVGDEEISCVINRRLFSAIEAREAKKNIDKFLSYADKEKILPEGMEKSVYRERFCKSFPFQPEVIDVLYHRWGSFPKFQRTRGVLRLLSLIVHALRNSKAPFIRLSDFDMKNTDIRGEFINQIGSEYSGVVSADITSHNSGSSKIDRYLEDTTYGPYSFGTKSAITIFLYSFSGGHEKGVSLKEIKLSVADTSFPTSIITEAVSKLKDEALLFLQHDAGKYFFTSEPNLNSLHLRKMENVEDTVVREIQKDLIRKNISDEHFQIFLNPRNPKDVPDTQEIKLVVFSNGGNDNQKRCRQFIDNYGQQPRVNRNTLVFLCPKEDELPILEKTIREYYAWDIIEREETKLLNDQQKKEVKDKKKEKSEYMIESLRNLYSIVYLPAANNSLKETDLGRYTYGKQMSLDNEVYQRLTNDGEILEKIAPLILKERYLKNDKDFIETKKLYQAFISTPGEMRLINEDVLKNAIRYGVKEGLFGIGELENGKPVCRYFKQEIESILPSGMLCEGEILIKESICIEQKKYPEEEETKGTTPIKGESETTKEGQEKGKPQDKKYSKVTLKLTIPPSELSKLASTVLYLSKLFKELDIKIDIAAKDGEISISDYEDKIKEAFMQSNIEIDDETLQ